MSLSVDKGGWEGATSRRRDARDRFLRAHKPQGTETSVAELRWAPDTHRRRRRCLDNYSAEFSVPLRRCPYRGGRSTSRAEALSA